MEKEKIVFKVGDKVRVKSREELMEDYKVYIQGVPGRGEEIKRTLLKLGGRIHSGMPALTFEDANFIYFVEPKDKNIYAVLRESLTGRVVQSSWGELTLAEKEEKEEKEDKFILVHDGRCMRRVAHGREEAENFKRWIQKDKPYAKVDVFKITHVEG